MIGIRKFTYGTGNPYILCRTCVTDPPLRKTFLVAALVEVTKTSSSLCSKFQVRHLVPLNTFSSQVVS